MKDIAQQIRTVVGEATDALFSMGLNEVSLKPGPDKWSKKEILGHLIDSAANNHQRFVRGAADKAEDFPAYSQDEWVRIQQYNLSDWPSLVRFWCAYNLHLCDLIERLPEEALSCFCNIGGEEPMSLAFVIKDYLRHLKHHINTLLERAD